ncbi:MAG: N-acetylmuramic acid 6-phosphate etherase [Mesorhizobium amorphae]|nr:MAG: N-acetylmuramic acid 6-phosphate etherase [Mesorhizobium amorphae]
MIQPATPAQQTEALRSEAAELDLLAPEAALTLLADSQAAAARAVRDAVPALALAAEAVAGALGGDGRLIYAAAGSSGLMALADALELPGTFGIAPARIRVLLAGGTQALFDLPGAPEDDEKQGAHEISEAAIGPNDCVIALAASGSTPYALGALREAKRRGARTIGLSNNPGTPILAEADIPVLLATAPEVVAGSTRMGAGTAQKIALNMVSTLAAVKLGHVHGPFMVNMRADNAKLRDRAARMVAAIAGIDESQARALLDRSGGRVKHAVLLAAGAPDEAQAEALLVEHQNNLRAALRALEESAL